jgi:hypothetical protein
MPPGNYCAAMKCMARGLLRVIFDQVTELSPRADVRFDPESDQDRAATQYVAMGHEATRASAAIASFDHLVGTGKHTRRYFQAECFGSLDVEHDGATSRSTISSASVRLQRLRLACRSGARLIPILATRQRSGPVLAMHVFGQIYSVNFERGPPCQKKRSRRRNRKPN